MLNFFKNRDARREKKALDSELLALFGITQSTAAGVQISVDTALRVPAVAAAVRTISEAAASLTVKVVDISATGVETENTSHAANALLKDHANDWTSGFEFIRSIVVDALCHDVGGLAWVNRVNGEPKELIKYKRGFIQVDYPDDTLAPVYRIDGVVRPSSEIIHVRSTFFEKSPISLCREAIAVALVMEQHAARLFGRSARPGGVIESPKAIGQEGSKAMLLGWKAAMEGAENAGKTAMLWDGATWKQMQLSSVDAQFQELRLFQLQEIARAFNVPASMLGDLTRATWSNSAEMQRQFLQLCLEPWLRAIESALRRALFLPDERARLAIRFDRDDFTNVDLTARATAINSLVASRVMNPNEGRSWLDLPPYAGGEEYANPNTGASQPGVGHNGGPPLTDPSKETQNEDA